MSEKCTLLLMEQNRIWLGNIPRAYAAAAVAALGADPDTFAEWLVAVGRFLHPSHQQQFTADPLPLPMAAELLAGDEPARSAQWHALDGWAFRLIDEGAIAPAIDLTSRVAYVPDEMHELLADVRYLGPTQRRQERVRFHLHAEWRLAGSASEWQTLVAERRPVYQRARSFHCREILYGPMMLEFILRTCRDEFERLDERDQRLYRGSEQFPAEPAAVLAWCVQHGDDDARASTRTVRNIHARWLLHPVPAADGATVRELLFRDREHVDACLTFHAGQWANSGICPPTLGDSCAAVERIGPGRHEAIVYYRLVRELIAAYLIRYAQAHRPHSIAVDLEWLAETRDRILECPLDFDGAQTMAQIALSERLRIPLVGIPQADELGCECTICRIMMRADAPPMFYFLGDEAQDDDYPFGYSATTAGACESRLADHWDDDGWDDEDVMGGSAREPDLFPTSIFPTLPDDSEELPDDNSLQSEQQQRAIADFRNSIWSFVQMGPEVHRGGREVTLFAIAAYTAELIADVKGMSVERCWVDALNERLDRFAGEIRSPEPNNLAVSVTEYCQTLGAMEAEFPDLKLKLYDLQNTLREILCDAL